MDNTADTAQVIIRPPLAWGLAVIAGFALNWLVPLPFLPVHLPAGWLGAMVFVFALALVVWAVVTITRAGSNVPTNLPTTTIVEAYAAGCSAPDGVQAHADLEASTEMERNAVGCVRHPLHARGCGSWRVGRANIGDAQRSA